MFDVSKVSKVYSGKRGCMCGCRGKWSYSSTSREAFTCRDMDGINDRSVKIIAGKLLRDPNLQVEQFGNTLCYFVDTETRTLAAYIEQEKQ